MVALGLAWRGVEVRAASSDRTAVTATTAQESAQGAVAPTLQLYSRETVVDVTVTDANGQPVHGLTQADFTVKENGKEQAIRSFKETDAAEAGMMNAPALEPAVHSNYRGAPASGPVNILLIDSLNASSTGMVLHVQRETEKYLKTMPEGTEVAVFSLSQGGLHVMQGFTPDRELLIGAVRRAAAMHGKVEGWTRQWMTTDALDEIAVYVSAIRGRKNLIWFTPGMPVMLIRDGGYSYGGGEMGPIHRLMDAYELLTRAQVAICPVDPRGVGPRMGMMSMLAEQVAEESGGKAYYNSNDLAAMVGKAIANGSEYYTLSYIPPGDKDDGHYHRIRVDVDRPGVKLVYRTGYDSEDPLAAKAIAPGPGLKQAVMAGRAMTGAEMQFDVKVVAIPAAEGAAGPRSAGAGRRLLPNQAAKPGGRYGLLYEVPASQIAFTQEADGMRIGSLEFDVAAYGANGAMTNIVSERVRLPLSAEEYAEFVKTPFHYFQQLEVPVGEAMVQVGIRDDVSKKVGTMDIPLTVAKGDGVVAGR
jgi:VWFA-related protein